jgi:hypothetical protein
MDSTQVEKSRVWSLKCRVDSRVAHTFAIRVNKIGWAREKINDTRLAGILVVLTKGTEERSPGPVGRQNG